jgi:hypothetical protein
MLQRNMEEIACLAGFGERRPGDAALRGVVITLSKALRLSAPAHRHRVAGNEYASART